MAGKATAPKVKAPAAIKAPVAATPNDLPDGWVYLRHPEGVGCGFGGAAIVPDQEGRIMAPLYAVGNFVPHGFLVMADD